MGTDSIERSVRLYPKRPGHRFQVFSIGLEACNYVPGQSRFLSVDFRVEEPLHHYVRVTSNAADRAPSSDWPPARLRLSQRSEQ